ncbi:MAG: hypothetical protein ACOX1F_05580 [Erysipelotrichaceae bacterium]|jgi:hypothetical protein
MKNLFDKLLSSPIILIVILILAVSVFLFFSKEKEEAVMTGEHHHSNDPKAPKDIDSLDLCYFSLNTIGTITEDSGFFYGPSSLEITLSIYDENDSYLLKKAKDKVEEFRQSGYMLWLSVSNKTPDDYVSFDIPVDKNFVEKFAALVRQSGIMSLNGTVDWTDGISPDAGQFILSARYKTNEKLSVSVNACVPNQASVLFKKLKPLFINKMIENNVNYIPLLNYDRTIINPQQLISSITIIQQHTTLLNTYNFNLIITDGTACLSGEFTDYDGTYNCNDIEIDESDLEILLNGFLSNRYVFVTDSFEHKNNVDIPEGSIFSFYIYFNGVKEGFKPYYGSFDDNVHDVVEIFKQMVKKYSFK